MICSFSLDIQSLLLYDALIGFHLTCGSKPIPIGKQFCPYQTGKHSHYDLATTYGNGSLFDENYFATPLSAAIPHPERGTYGTTERHESTG